MFNTFLNGFAKKAFDSTTRRFASNTASSHLGGVFRTLGRHNHQIKSFAKPASVVGCGFAFGAGLAFAQPLRPYSHSIDPKFNASYRKAAANDIQIHDKESIRVFSGRANPALSKEIADLLHLNLGAIDIKGYADGEIGIQVLDNVRGKEVYLIQPTCPPGINDHLVELLLLISTMKRASAASITAVIPYYGYARQDRKLASRVPISAADVARLFEAMGVDRVVAVDLHCGQIQGFFGPSTPCDNLEGQVVGLDYFHSLGLNSDTTKVISPDAGGVYRAKRFRDGLHERGVDAGLAMIIKQRVQSNQIERMDLVGEVDGSDVIIVDDMIDTAGTLTQAAKELKERGAKRVYAFSTHGLFSGPAYERIDQSELEKVVVCNTIPLDPNKKSSKIVQLSVAKLLAEAIARIHSQSSVSALFKSDPSESEVEEENDSKPSNKH